MIPESVWKAEARHKGIWQSAGPCVSCRIAPRDIVCRFCGEPMCSKCIKAHEDAAHARDRYIERIALGKIKSGVTPDERWDAEALKAKWREADEEIEPGETMSASA